MARGWSPAGAKSETTLNGGTARSVPGSVGAATQVGPPSASDLALPRGGPQKDRAFSPLVGSMSGTRSEAFASSTTASDDATEVLSSLTTAIRWATTALALLLLSTGDGSQSQAIAGAVVLSLSLFRTVRPFRYRGIARFEASGILVEALIFVVVIGGTDHWDSPYVFGLATVITAAGFAGGLLVAITAAGLSLAAVAIPYHLATQQPSLNLTVQWAGEMILIAILAGYVRRLLLQGRAEASQFLTRFNKLSEMNSLLLKLHGAAKTLPASLDLDETIESSSARLRDLFDPAVVAVLLRDGPMWSVVKASGASLDRHIPAEQLPAFLRQAAEASKPQLAAPLGGAGPVGLAAESTSGIYAPLVARQEVIGLLAVERNEPLPFGAQHIVLMEGFAQQMAIAVDNARWFSRIGTLSAEKERSRIARDLHDRVGQSLALVGFELDRIGSAGSDPDLRRQIKEVRESVRVAVGELRESLYDLRTDVSEEKDLVAALAAFTARVRERSGLEIRFTHHVSGRLALPIERETWRIAQEAIANAVRHARATCITVSCTIDTDGAELTVVDDGQGMPAGGGHRAEGYGLVGMHERAAAIGATLTISSPPDRGTLVRLHFSRKP